MNIRNLFGLKYLAMMLLAALTFSSCEEDEFTAEDAYALEEQRLRLLDELESARETRDAANAMAMAQFQASIDSLRAVNSGGRVLYTVGLFAGESSVFSGGRAEEAEGALNGATVSVDQYGIATEVTTGTDGLASFLLYSGEVTVNATAADYTTVSYVANLTPDGGVPNGGTAHVGNVVPLFYNGANADQMAMIAGRFFAELDVTDFQEEVLTSSTQFLAGQPGVAAYIDPNPAFIAEYIAEANNDGPVNESGEGTFSGAIQRIAYGNAGGVARPDASGDYALMVSATGSGLQTRMEYSEFAATQTFFSNSPYDNEGGSGFATQYVATDARVLFGPNVGPATHLGNDIISDINARGVFLRTDAVLNGVSFTNAPATVTATITSNGELTNFTIEDGGAYVLPPAISFPAPTGGGTVPTLTVDLSSTVINSASGSPTALRELDVNETGFFDGNTVVSSSGSGYTSADLNYDSNNDNVPDAILAVITPQQTGITGTGTIQAASNSLNTAFVRILDGGFGFNNSNIDGVSEGAWTGISPWINYQDITTPEPTGTDVITATYIYDDGGVGATTGGVATSATYTYVAPGTTAGTAFSTVEEIRIDAGGDDWTTQALAELNDTPFRYFLTAATIPVADPDGETFLTIDATATTIINEDYGIGTGATATNTLGTTAGLNGTQTSIDFSAAEAAGFNGFTGFSRGSGYVFVPSVNILTTIGGVDASVTVGQVGTADAGQIVSFILGASTITNDNQVNAITIVAPTNSLDAEFFTAGGSIDNYTVNQANTPNLTSNTIISNPSPDATNAVRNALQLNLNDQLNVPADAGVADANAAAVNTYVALFGTPTGANGTRAYGYPVFNSTFTQVIGLEMYSGGISYEGNTTWELVAVDQEDALVFAQPADAIVTFSITDGGSYAVTPRVRLFDGGSFAYEFDPVPTADVNMNVDGSIGSIDAQSLDAAFDGTTAISVVVDTDAQDGEASSVLNGILTGTTPTGGFSTNIADVVHFGGRTTDGTGFVPGAVTSVGDVDRPGGAVPGNVVAALNNPNFAGGAYEAVVAGDTGPEPAWMTPWSISTSGIFGGSGLVTTVNIDPVDGSFNGFSIVSGGAGYFEDLTALNRELEGFKVVGGPDGNTTGAFETFTGLSYVRDIHYGVGRLLE